MLCGAAGMIPYAVLIAVDVKWAARLSAFALPLSLVTLIFYLFGLYWIISTFLAFLLLIRNPEKKLIDLFYAGTKLVWGDLAVGVISFLLVALWSLLFVIPGIIFMVFYSFARFAFVYDGYRRSAALARSKELVSGNWWAVTGRILLAMLIVLVVGGLFGFLFSASHVLAVSIIARIMYYLIAFFLFAPLIGIYSALMYGDLAAIKPASSLPKEKNDYWLVVLATVALIAAVLAFLSLIAMMIMSVS
ncbi:MAG TPA: hypothetical protein VMC41_02760 [Candidatus Nanoarchaeia archaeon]|nr:hypothetical protein [Candidatus Nanoarchaeia archaeon]